MKKRIVCIICLFLWCQSPFFGTILFLLFFSFSFQTFNNLTSETSSNFFKLLQTPSNSSQTCSNLTKNCPNLSNLFSTFLNLSKLVQTHPTKVSKLVQTCSNLTKLFKTCLNFALKWFIPNHIPLSPPFVQSLLDNFEII